MSDQLQEDDARGQDLVSGAKDREATRQAAASGQNLDASLAAGANKAGASPQAGMASRIGGAARGAGKLALKYKKPAGLGGGVIGLIIASILGLNGFLTVFEAVHVAENLKNDVMKKLNHMEQKESAKILQAILAKAARPINVIKGAHPNPVEENISTTNADGFKNDLAAHNITETVTPDGLLKSLTGPDGKAIDLAADPKALNAHPDLVAGTVDALPIQEAQIRGVYEPTLHYQDGVAFDQITGDDKQKIKEEIDKKVRQGESGKLGGDTTKNPADSKAPANDTIKAAQDEYALANDSEAAAKKGIKEMFKPSLKTVEILVATIACSVQQIMHDNALSSYARKSKELMRLSNVLFSIGDQSKSGQKMSLKAYGTFVSSELNGNPRSNNAENRKGFDQSAGWKQTTGQPVTAANPAINSAADPNQNSALTSAVGTVINSGLVNAGCIVLLSPVGGPVIASLDAIAHAVVALFTGTTSELADVAGEVAVQTAENYALGAVIDQSIKHSSYLSGFLDKLSTIILSGADLVITGNENAVQFLNNAKLGGDMSANTTARTLGGHRLSKTASLKLVATAEHEQAIAMSKTSLWNRTMSLANVDSIASRILIKMPFTKEQAIADIFKFPRMPNILLGNIKSIFIPAATADASANFSNSQQFGFTDEELAKYPVDTNSNYMTDPANGVSVPLTAATSVMVPRSFILGDPSAYAPSKGDIKPCDGTSDDNGTTIKVGVCPALGTYGGARTNINDFIGCFVNAVQDPAVARATGCGDLLDFQQIDNPALIADSMFQGFYCNGVPPIETNVCHVPAGFDNEMTRYGIFLFDYHLSKSIKEYADASTGKFYDSAAATANANNKTPLRSVLATIASTFTQFTTNLNQGSLR